jgi:hypothetical protein
MRKISFFAFLFFSVSICFGQGFDKDMIKSGKEFHKHSKRVGQSSSKKNKRVSTLNGNRMQKKNRAQRKNSPAKKD